MIHLNRISSNKPLPLSMAKTAIILGGTGLTGSLVMEVLLNDERYDCVKLFSRKPVNQKHPKLKEFLVDVLDLDSVKSVVRPEQRAQSADRQRQARVGISSVRIHGSG